MNFGVTDDNGEFVFDWTIDKSVCPLPTPSGPGQTSVTIYAQVVGYNLQANKTLSLIRYLP